MTETGGNLAAALVKAQGAFPAIVKDKEVKVVTKAGKEYKFKYAPLDSILEAVRKPLADNGLVVVQMLDDGGLSTILLHESGERLGGTVALPAGDDIQGFGSAITYMRRYAIQALLGIAAEDDDDGNRASGHQAETTVAGGETLEMLGNLSKSGSFVKGTASQYKGEWRDGPNGHSIGLRLKLAGEDRDIPQVVITGPIGEALWLATEGKPENIIGGTVHVKGRLFGVRQPGKATYYRLVIGEAPTDFIETPEWRIPSEPPAGEETRPEAEPVAPGQEAFDLSAEALA